MTWNAEIELDIRLTTRNAEKLAGEWLPALADYHAVIASGRTGNASVLITLPAESLRQATMTAIAVVQEATGRTATAAQVMTTEAFDAIDDAQAEAGASGVETIPELMSVPAAAEILGMTRQGLLDRVQQERIPGVQVGKAWVVLASAVRAEAEARGRTL